MVETKSSSQSDLSKFINWILVWILLANIVFIVMWFFGAPLRMFEITLAGIIGLLLRHQSPKIQTTAFAAILSFSVISFIAGTFNLERKALLQSFQYAGELNPLQSPEYIIAAAALFIVLIMAYFRIRKGNDFKQSKYGILAVASILSLVGLDHMMSLNMRGHYNRTAPPDGHFDSALKQSGFAETITDDRHLVLIMLESLGSPKNNPAMEKLLFSSLKTQKVRDKYDIVEGETLFFKSTTSGEIRELCGNWNDYFDLLDNKAPDCLPAKLARQGYDTLAYHGFSQDFFDRSLWYPNIGFETSAFYEQMQNMGIDVCPGVFAGGCDSKIPDLIFSRLKTQTKPTFLYWLSLNTHIPIPAHAALKSERCDDFSEELSKSHMMICRQLKIFNQIDQAIARNITMEDFPKADILIVGDHIPPFLNRNNRSQYDPEHVPWIYLKAK